MNEDELKAIEERVERFLAAQDAYIKDINSVGSSTMKTIEALSKAALGLQYNGTTDIPALVAEVRRLREALAEYADPQNWFGDGYSDYDNDWYFRSENGWDRAERALKGELPTPPSAG